LSISMISLLSFLFSIFLIIIFLLFSILFTHHFLQPNFFIQYLCNFQHFGVNSSNFLCIFFTEFLLLFLNEFKFIVCDFDILFN
jgi:hypothetical protein